MSDQLPVTFEATVTIERVGDGWQILMDTDNHLVSHWTEYPDGLYDDLISANLIDHD